MDAFSTLAVVDDTSRYAVEESNFPAPIYKIGPIYQIGYGADAPRSVGAIRIPPTDIPYSMFYLRPSHARPHV